MSAGTDLWFCHYTLIWHNNISCWLVSNSLPDSNFLLSVHHYFMLGQTMCSRGNPTFEFLSCCLVICQGNDNEKCILLMCCAAVRGALLHVWSCAAVGALKCLQTLCLTFFVGPRWQGRRNLVESYFLFFKARGREEDGDREKDSGRDSGRERKWQRGVS